MAKQDIQEQTQHSQDGGVSKKQQKKQAKREAKLMLKLQQARKDEHKAEQKLAKAHQNLTTSQATISSLEQQLAQLRAEQQQAPELEAEHHEIEVIDSGDDYNGTEPSEQRLAPQPAEGRDDILEEQKQLEALGHDVVAVERQQVHTEPGGNSTPEVHNTAAKERTEEPEKPTRTSAAARNRKRKSSTAAEQEAEATHNQAAESEETTESNPPSKAHARRVHHDQDAKDET